MVFGWYKRFKESCISQAKFGKKADNPNRSRYFTKGSLDSMIVSVEDTFWTGWNILKRKLGESARKPKTLPVLQRKARNQPVFQKSYKQVGAISHPQYPALILSNGQRKININPSEELLPTGSPAESIPFKRYPAYDPKEDMQSCKSMQILEERFGRYLQRTPEQAYHTHNLNDIIHGTYIARDAVRLEALADNYVSVHSNLKDRSDKKAIATVEAVARLRAKYEKEVYDRTQNFEDYLLTHIEVEGFFVRDSHAPTNTAFITEGGTIHKAELYRSLSDKGKAAFTRLLRDKIGRQKYETKRNLEAIRAAA